MKKGVKRKIIQGLYLITSKQNSSKKYVGFSFDIDRRWWRHKTELKMGCHHNSLIQNHVNKYGLEDLEFSIFEALPNLGEKELKQKEMEAINNLNLYHGDNENGWNLTRGGDGGTTKELACSFENIKTGEIRNFKSRPDASKSIGCSLAQIQKVVVGKANSAKGWCRVGERKREAILKKERYKQVEKILYHDVYGEVHFYNTSQFAKKYSLSCTLVGKLIGGTCVNHRGWRATPKLKKGSKVNNLNPNNYRHKTIKLYHDSFGSIELKNISEFVKKYNLSSSGIYSVLSKKRKTHKGWRLNK